MKYLKKISDVAQKVCDEIGAFFILFIFISVILQVVVRKAGGSITWTDEAGRYGFILVIYFGCMTMARKGSYIRIDGVLEKMPLKGRVIAEVIINTIVIALTLVYMYAIFCAYKTAGDITFNIIRFIKMKHFYMVTEVAFAFVVLASVCRYDDILSMKKAEEKKGEITK